MNEIKNIRKLISQNADRKMADIFFIAVDGHGGSGKTTLANLLSKKLNAEIIHTDDFASWENPVNWWPILIEKVFQPIKDGEKFVSYKRSSWAVNHKPEPIIDQPVTEIMIVEGVGSSRKEFEKYIGLSIFVDTSEDVCLERGM